MADYYAPYDGPAKEKKKKKAPKPQKKPDKREVDFEKKKGRKMTKAEKAMSYESMKGYGCGGMAKHNKGGQVATHCSYLHDKAKMQKKGKK